MTIRANMFTPQALLSAPRRSAGVPNLAGTHVLYTQSTYSFEKHEKKTELRLLDVQKNESTLITAENGVSDPVWLEGEDGTFLVLKSDKEGSTNVVVHKVAGSSHVAGNIDAPASSLKVAKLSESKYAVVVVAQAYPDGTIYNPEKAKKNQSTGRLYKKLFVRLWDAYVGKEKNALWYGTLSKKGDQYSLSTLRNALKHTKLESPIPTFDGTDHFDVSSTGIIFVSKDQDLDPALNTKCRTYLIDFSTFEEDAPEPYDLSLPKFEGASTSPVFSPDGKMAAYLTMKTAGYEADQNEIVLILDVKDAKSVSLYSTKFSSLQKWDRSPQSITFSHDSKFLYCPAEDQGYGRLFAFPITADYQRPYPIALTNTGYVSDVYALSSGRVFASGSTLTDNSFYAIISLQLDANVSPSEDWIHSASRVGSSLGLSPSQVSSIRFPASNPTVNREVHAWVVKPSNFDKGKKYPVAFLIHGGPQGSWADSWSTRWNPAVFAEQGYIVVAPNVTGSTGYGQAFTDAIRKDWGGAPYHDIENCFDYVAKNMPEANIDRAVALGASYGGYMMNWIQGHPLGRKFKALVCHDGIFSMSGLLATEELYFPFTDLGGTPWYHLPKSSAIDSPALASHEKTRLDRLAKQAHNTFGTTSVEAWQKNDPSNHLDQWSTPELVIHNSKDYRLCISEGLAAFNVLQARGVESQFLTFPDENHFVLAPENSLVWHKTVINWINGHVGLPLIANEADEEAFFGGYRKEGDEVVTMEGMGKPET